MQTIKTDQADAFARSPPRDLRAFLVIGPDEGLVAERSRALIKALAERAGSDASVTRIEGDRLAADPDAYVSDLYGASLFGGARILALQQGARDISGALQPVLTSPAEDLWLILEAADVKKDRDAALRALFAAAPKSAAIDCALEDRVSIGRLIEEEARQRNVAVSPEARAALLDLLGPDRLSNRHELEKLFLYAQETAKVDLEDVEAVVAGQDRSPLEEIFDRLLAGDPKALDAFDADSPDIQAFAFRLVWRLTLLMGVSEEMARGHSFSQALRETGARVPYAMTQRLQRQAERWNPAALRRLAPALARYLARSRLHNRMAGILLERFLWNLKSPGR